LRGRTLAPRGGKNQGQVTGKLDYLAGGFYSDERILSRDGVKTAPGYDQFIVGLLGGVNYLSAFTGLPLGSNYQIGSGQTDVFNQKSRSFALFTHNSYKATDRLTVTGGLRLTTESKALTADLKSTGDGCNAAIARFGSSLTGIPASLRSIICGAAQDPRYAGVLKGDRNESEWSGTASAGYKFAERLNGYLSYSRGYKGGGYQYDRTGLLLAGPAISQLSFTPEFADSYEAGLKGVFLEGKLRGNAALFYTQISDYQFNYLKVLPLQSARVTANLPELVSKGVELDGAFRLIANLTLTAAATYNEVAYGDSDFPTGLTQLQGTMAPYAPRWSLQSAINYEHAIPGTALEGFAYLDANWRSTTNLSFSATTTPIYFQKSYALAHMRVGLGRQDGRWQVEAFAKNLFDRRAWSGLYTATAQSGSVEGFFIEPRFYGVTLRAKFGG
ncbi:MAG: TonB-dependent receptor, partial [bacterium]|nr:TonB-dependent receptor [bacterium]